MLAGAGANLSVDRRSRRNRREFRVARATCGSRSARVSAPHLRSLRRGLANQPGLLRSVLHPGHWYAHSLYRGNFGCSSKSMSIPQVLLCAVPVVHPHQVATRRERIHSGTRRRPRDSTSRVRVLVEVDVHTSGIQPGFLLLCAVPVVHPHQVATRRERIATAVLAADHVTVRLVVWHPAAFVPPPCPRAVPTGTDRSNIASRTASPVVVLSLIPCGAPESTRNSR